jgi:hypothetical protein
LLLLLQCTRTKKRGIDTGHLLKLLLPKVAKHPGTLHQVLILLIELIPCVLVRTLRTLRFDSRQIVLQVPVGFRLHESRASTAQTAHSSSLCA